MQPTSQDLYDVIEATWPPLHCFKEGVWTLRDGAGGGKRAAAATATGLVTQDDLAIMETAMARLGQAPLVMVRAGQDVLDQFLDSAGYTVVDPVVLYAAPVDILTAPLPPVSAFAHWPRLAITTDMWAKGGIGPARLDVMARVKGHKSAVLARTEDTPAGVAFVAIHKKIAMIHAIEVSPNLRRKGTARNIMRAAANWAQDLGADQFSLAVTERNTGARALYTSLGLEVVGHYHYRLKEPTKGPSR